MTKEEVWNEYMTPKWISANGLGRLDPYPDLDLDGGFIDGNGLECVRNENGILFLAYFLLTAKIAGINIHQYRDTFYQTVETLVHKSYRGLFNRRPYGDMKVDRHEAHDNYAAICGIGALYGMSYAQEVLSYGQSRGYNYNNVDPDKYETKQQRQGGEIAFYKLCAGFSPAIWEWIWWMGGLIINAFKNNAGETQLAWLRLYVASRLELVSPTHKLTLYLVSFIWKMQKDRQFGSLGAVYKQYFKDYHPIHKMAALIPDHEWGF